MNEVTFTGEVTITFLNEDDLAARTQAAMVRYEEDCLQEKARRWLRYIIRHTHDVNLRQWATGASRLDKLDWMQILLAEASHRQLTRISAKTADWKKEGF